MATEILAPMPGTIVNVLVKEGDEVLEYQEVVILEAMKMENAIPTPEAGKVREIKVKKDDKVSTNQVLMVLEQYTFQPFHKHEQIKGPDSSRSLGLLFLYHFYKTTKIKTRSAGACAA